MNITKYLTILTATIVVGFITLTAVQIIEKKAEFIMTKIKSKIIKPKNSVAPKKSTSPKPSINDNVSPILPDIFPAFVGQNLTLYYDGLVTAYDPNDYTFEFTSPTLNGSSERRKWTAKILPKHLGDHSLTLKVKSLKDGKLLGVGNTNVIVVDPPKPKKNINILIVGDSLIHQGAVPNLLWKKLDHWSGGKIFFKGSKPLKDVFSFYEAPLPGVNHEGYGGWGWKKFTSHYMPQKKDIHKIPKSPFIFLDKGNPSLNVKKYLRQKNLTGNLNAVIFYLGINGTFNANPNDPKNMSVIITKTLNWADKLINAFKVSAPETKIIVGIPAPFTRSNSIFLNRYGPKFADAWKHRQIVLALARHMIKHFKNKRHSDVVLVPLHAIIDVIDGYYQIDPGHPNKIGAEQMATTFKASLLLSINDLLKNKM